MGAVNDSNRGVQEEKGKKDASTVRTGFSYKGQEHT